MFPFGDYVITWQPHQPGTVPGLQVWVGYGRNVSDMVSGSKFARVYPVD
jgi:hypothetical protein